VGRARLYSDSQRERATAPSMENNTTLRDESMHSRAQKSGTRPRGEITTKPCGEVMLPERATVPRGWSAAAAAAATPQLLRSVRTRDSRGESFISLRGESCSPRTRESCYPRVQESCSPRSGELHSPERGSCALSACKSLAGVRLSPSERVARPRATPRRAISVSKSCRRE
jgi:hypothetical protein